MARSCRVYMQSKDTTVNGTIKRPLVKVHERNFMEYYVS